jgi:hypothetical protein
MWEQQNGVRFGKVAEIKHFEKYGFGEKDEGVDGKDWSGRGRRGGRECAVRAYRVSNGFEYLFRALLKG